ncbi:uncharacterized protein PHACADRAFT_259040 [Phanerochaete carnosa HHB-10118-sp]|uniref:Uncharacterized protein n=1 Tax=Phanerochaete carnosa (strain HHB-10118-sp) TaxID=650164 RepID=K5UXR4_PHACS|nr:uncharacterized protein PHACADRAFT_259040 [Phanerochaete carnosa HHB-10118-sp]EKM54876.1 hypothetical protein PHACADRAFT_259040 [Phanerochaete carnosa HHB-10118-sp]
MPALQELLIRGTSVLQATRTLGDALRDGEDEPLVPELNILRLEPFDDVPVSDGISLGDWVAQLQEPLAYRTKRGLTLSELRLTLPVTADRIQYESLISGWSSVVAGKVELQVASEARSC